MALVSTDPIADMLTRVRNAILAGKHEVRLPHSRVKEMVARTLQTSGYLSNVTVEKASPRDELIITIHPEGEATVISEIDRVSRPGRRVYVAAADIPRVKSGRGIMLVSTSKGILTDNEARKQRLGGELICKVY